METERDETSGTLRYKLTRANWQSYRDLQWQKANREKTLQREADRSKGRGFVMENEDAPN